MFRLSTPTEGRRCIALASVTRHSTRRRQTSQTPPFCFPALDARMQPRHRDQLRTVWLNFSSCEISVAQVVSNRTTAQSSPHFSQT